MRWLMPKLSRLTGSFRMGALDDPHHFFEGTAIPGLSKCNMCHGAAVFEDSQIEHLQWHRRLAAALDVRDIPALQDSVLAVQRTLGINPQGDAHETVVERLDHIEQMQLNQAQHFHVYEDHGIDKTTTEMRITLG